ncbi:MAG TPA: helix-turn-helix domain-containing protein [Vicinamibacterales bacterium]|nr:helix-turn-helix domain-containing protein [Vicinamibacterales bacterium]
MSRRKDAKREALRETGALNPRPELVTDPLFREHEFFDRRDLVQVKYEMLRRVQVDGLSITEAAKAFGFSRPSFYQAQAMLAQRGLPGLIRRRPGPQHPSKLSDEVVAYLEDQLALDALLRAPALAERILERFGLSVHPRSVERALRRRKKGR